MERAHHDHKDPPLSDEVFKGRYELLGFGAQYKVFMLDAPPPDFSTLDLSGDLETIGRQIPDEKVLKVGLSDDEIDMQ